MELEFRWLLSLPIGFGLYLYPEVVHVWAGHLCVQGSILGNDVLLDVGGDKNTAGYWVHLNIDGLGLA